MRSWFERTRGTRDALTQNAFDLAGIIDEVCCAFRLGHADEHAFAKLGVVAFKAQPAQYALCPERSQYFGCRNIETHHRLMKDRTFECARDAADRAKVAEEHEDPFVASGSDATQPFRTEQRHV